MINIIFIIIGIVNILVEESGSFIVVGEIILNNVLLCDVNFFFRF